MIVKTLLLAPLVLLAACDPSADRPAPSASSLKPAASSSGAGTASYLGALPNEILRLDLKTRLTAIWFYRPGRSIEWIGVDSKGQAIVSAAPRDGVGDDWLITAPGVATKIDLDSPQMAWANRRAILSTQNGAASYLPKPDGSVENKTGQPYSPAGDGA
jgi:hypothetical protein